MKKMRDSQKKESKGVLWILVKMRGSDGLSRKTNTEATGTNAEFFQDKVDIRYQWCLWLAEHYSPVGW